MKLRNLNGAIRKAAPAVTVILQTPVGDLTVALQKSSLLDALKALPVDSTDETGIEVTEAGVLTWDVPAARIPDFDVSDIVGKSFLAPPGVLMPAACQPDDQVDLEDLLASPAAPIPPADDLDELLG